MCYWICEAKSAEVLRDLVNDHIEKGWTPLGGMVVVQSRSTSDWWFYQAMIHEEATPADLRDPDLS